MRIMKNQNKPKEHEERLKKLENTIDEEISLILTDALAYQKIIVDILKNLVVEKKMNGVYVALNKPSKTLTKYFKDNGIDTENLFFVETQTKTAQKIALNANVLLLTSAQNLTKISIVLDGLMMENKYEFVVFDTVDSFLSYHTKHVLERFFYHFLTGMRTRNKKIIMVGIKELLKDGLIHLTLEKLSDSTLDLVPHVARFQELFMKL